MLPSKENMKRLIKLLETEVSYFEKQDMGAMILSETYELGEYTACQHILMLMGKRHGVEAKWNYCTEEEWSKLLGKVADYLSKNTKHKGDFNPYADKRTYDYLKGIERVASSVCEILYHLNETNEDAWFFEI